VEGEVSDTFEFPTHDNQYGRVLLDVTPPYVPFPFLTVVRESHSSLAPLRGVLNSQQQQTKQRSNTG
jgi:hypothetical protein